MIALAASCHSAISVVLTLYANTGQMLSTLTASIVTSTSRRGIHGMARRERTRTRTRLG